MEGAGEYTGKTIEDALTQAQHDLGVAREDLEYDVLSQGSRGVFGIGAEEARVRAWPKAAPVAAGAITESVSVTATVYEDDIDEGTGESWEDEENEDENERPDVTVETDEELADAALSVVENLLGTMKINAGVSISSVEPPVMLSISGDNLGVLIGRRGDNLSALQFMVNLILSKNRRHWPHVVLDVENYRARREESLRTLADRVAYRVQRNGRPFTLEAMPAGDRRIIHLALRDHNSVETYSIGEGPSRRVVVAPRRGISAAR